MSIIGKCFRKMSTRFVYTVQPVLYHQNGHQVAKRDMPSMTNIKRFLSTVIERVMIDRNPADAHRCNALCRQPVQLLFGFPHCGEVKEPIKNLEKGDNVLMGFADDSVILLKWDASSGIQSNRRFIAVGSNLRTSAINRNSFSSDKESFPSNLAHMVEDFERLISTVTYKSMERCELQTVALRLLPCSKVLEIIDAAIYL